MDFAKDSYRIFEETTALYHDYDNVDAKVENPYKEGSIEHTLFAKNWIDAVQWHLEDIIRDPAIDPVDTYFREKYDDVAVLADATINTESPAWALDRLSILALKIYHMQAEVDRTDASPEHIAKCRAKLDVLSEQRADLISAIDQLLDDIAAGKKYMKVYRQMKMYNDPATNPVLYGQKQ